MSEKQIVWISVLYRLINCCLVQTSFVPDEYWQSLEPAHRLVFGCGGLSWEWHEGLRSYIYPLIFAFFYKALAIFYLDTRFLIVHVPHLVQSSLAVISDVYFYKFSKKLYGEKAALWTLVCFWSNWFTFFCAPRTLANTIESQLTIIGLYYYPWPPNYLFDSGKRQIWSSIYLTIVAFATVVRPTSAVFWLPLCVWNLVRAQRPVPFMVKTVLPMTIPILVLSIVCDYFCYGSLIVPLWRFLKFNVLQGGSAYFGVHPWHWYFTNCLPTICFTQGILVACGIYATKDRTMVALCLFYIFIHSLLAHKELRFLLPLLAPLFTYAGRYIDSLFRRYADKADKQFNFDSIASFIKATPTRIIALITFLLITNLPIMVYTSLFHQRGVLDVIKYLHDQSLDVSSQGTNHSVSAWSLMPCYTSPGCSHTHVPVHLRMLDCTPNLAQKPNYVDEADEFHLDPVAWIDREFTAHSAALPSHVILYDWMWTKVGQPLEEFGFRRCAEFYNTNFPQSERQSKYLIVACKSL